MHITITGPQITAIHDNASDLIYDGIASVQHDVNPKRLWIDDNQVSRATDILASRLNKVSGKDARVLRNVLNKITEATQDQEPDAEELADMTDVNSAGTPDLSTMNAAELRKWDEQQDEDDDDPIEPEAWEELERDADGLPLPVRLAVLSVNNGDYGDEAARLLKTMDDREGERPTRWVARLRHKLVSAGLTEPANHLRLTA